MKDDLEGMRLFYLVDSHTLPKNDEKFRMELGENETFETDWIGASEQDCQKWTLEKQYQVNWISQDVIAIADARSARDDTILIQFHSRVEPEPLEFGRYGVLPQEQNTWYNFRVELSKADPVLCSLSEGAFDCVYPVYFGHKEMLTDVHGVFDVDKAERLVRGEDPESETIHQF